MHRIDGPGAVNGLFTEGDPTAPQMATVVSADWLNDVQENLARAIESAGITPVKGDYNQLAQAIGSLIARFMDASSVLDLYVRPDGADANNGLSNASNGAFATIAGAIAAVRKRYASFAGSINIHVAAGTYAGFSVSLKHVGEVNVICTGNVEIGSIALKNGAVVNIAKATISGSGDVVSLTDGGVLSLTDCTIRGNGADNGILSAAGSQVQLYGTVFMTGTFAWAAMAAARSGSIVMGSGLKLSLSVACNIVASAVEGGLISNMSATGVTVSGASTGTRYHAAMCGTIFTNGGGANYFPGSLAGAVDTGGVYA